MATAPKVHKAFTERQRRGTTTERGYGADWQKLKRWYRKRHPLCERCKAKGKTVIGQHVHHIIEFESVHDPRRLAINNLETLCEACHTAHHKRPHNGPR